MSCILYLMFR